MLGHARHQTRHGDTCQNANTNNVFLSTARAWPVTRRATAKQFAASAMGACVGDHN